MRIRDMFQKSIDRDIKGVIKVGQGDDEILLSIARSKTTGFSRLAFSKFFVFE